jgi:prevent-host-death family protein
LKTISISDARSRMPSVIEEVVHTHEQIVLTRYGAPMVAIVPVANVKAANRYPLRGRPIASADDFDAPMPELWGALALAEERNEYRVGKGTVSHGSSPTRPQQRASDKHRTRIGKGLAS